MRPRQSVADHQTQPPASLRQAPSRWVFTAQWIPFLASLLCLLPVLLFWGEFQKLYWFDDEWDIALQMQRYGSAASILKLFGENFIPLFRALWVSAIYVFHGSYSAMILLLWATHLAILWLTAAILRRCGFDWKCQTVAILTLGLAWSNIETLGWALQWSALLATFFFLLGWLSVLQWQRQGQPYFLGFLAVCCSLASTFSFLRGILTGVLLAFYLLLSANRPLQQRRRLIFGLAGTTAALLLCYRFLWNGPNAVQHFDGSSLLRMGNYALYYLLLSPLYYFVPLPHKAVDLRDLLIVGSLKVVIVAAGFKVARSEQRPLLWTLLLFDLGTGCLQAAGRYQLDIATSVSYRYQHVSLLCFGPFLALVAVEVFGMIIPSKMRVAAGAAALTVWALILGVPWDRHLHRWTLSRGANLKTELFAAPPDQRFGLSQETAAQARKLIQLYHLH
jgi:hypothetical protein